jgi:glycosyltransferase involved in cell wall biosynthesis
LHSLITDFAIVPGISDWFEILLPRILSRLRRRVLPDLATTAVHTYASVNLFEILTRTILAKEDRYEMLNSILSFRTRNISLGNANVLLTTYGHGGHLIERARREGLKIVTDFYITPDCYGLVSKVRAQLGLSGCGTDRRNEFVWEKTTQRLLELSDLYICPTERVAKDLATRSAFRPGNAKVLPYPVAHLVEGPQTPKRGRVLFAGAFGIRKGGHIVIELARRFPEMQFVVAGSVRDELRDAARNSRIEFLGHLSRARMDEEYLRADVFLLPSIAEGSSGAVLEAMSAGVPVVISEQASSIARNGEDGFVLSSNGLDCGPYETPLATLVGDRDLRRHMSTSAYMRSRAFSTQSWGEELFRLLNGLASRG